VLPTPRETQSWVGAQRRGIGVPRRDRSPRHTAVWQPQLDGALPTADEPQQAAFSSGWQQLVNSVLAQQVSGPARAGRATHDAAAGLVARTIADAA
jgi:hypothetical protein